MKFTTTTIIASTLALASARACPNPNTNTQPQSGAHSIDPKSINVFRLFALIKDGPYAQNSTIQYSKKGLAINVQQDAKCRDTTVNYASLTIAAKDADYQPGGLFLYSGNPPIQAYVDRSGMGQGILQFSQGVGAPPARNAERGPWEITNDLELVYAPANGVNHFQACTDDAGKTFSVWMRGVDTAGGHKECVPFTAQVWPVDTSEAENANQCTYDF